MEFLPLASEQRTPQSRMRNRRGPEKESFFKIFEGKKIQENYWNYCVLTSNFHLTLPAPRGVSCWFNQVSLLPAAAHPPAPRARHWAAVLGWNSHRATGCERCSAALKAKNPPWASPERALAILLYCTCRNAWRNPGDLGFLIYLHIPKFSHFAEKWCRHP